MLVKYSDVGSAKLTWRTNHHTLTPKTLAKEIKKSGALMSGSLLFSISLNKNLIPQGVIMVPWNRVVGYFNYETPYPDPEKMAKHWNVIKSKDELNIVMYEGSYCPPELHLALTPGLLS